MIYVEKKIQNLCPNSSSKCLLSKAFKPHQRICRTVSYAIPPQNQLVMRKTLKSFMAFDIIPRMPVFTVVAGSQIVDPPNNSSLTMTLPRLEPVTLAQIPFVELRAMSFHLKTNS